MYLDIKRHCGIACSRDPFTPSDLKELKGFPMSEIRDTILPAGFGLDEFGIIVHEQFAVPRPPQRFAVPDRLPNPTYQPSPPIAPAIQNYQMRPKPTARSLPSNQPAPNMPKQSKPAR